MAEATEELRKQVAIANRLMGAEFGVAARHVSARIPGSNEMVHRCRGGGAEGGMEYTDLHHVRQLNFDGEGHGLGKRYFAPAETPIHGEI